MNSGVYLLKNKINGKLYVGKSLNIPARWKTYARNERKNYKKHTQPIVNAIKKYGWHNFERTIIEEVQDSTILLERERYWITFYQVTNKEIGYNICLFNTDTTGHKHSIETKRKMSLAQKGKKKNFSPEYLAILRQRITSIHCKGKDNPMYGQKHKKDTLAKMSSTITEGYRNGTILGTRGVNQIDKATNQIIKTWYCLGAAAESVCGNRQASGNISNVCRGKRKSYLGYKWAYT